MKHALPPLVYPNSQCLIIGTMPGEKSIALQQYYGNRGNQFWRMLFTIFDEPFSMDYTARKHLLQRHHIALWNVLASCERDGSSDSKIRNEIPNDFAAFHAQHPKIFKVFFESISAQKYYDKYSTRLPNIEYCVLPSTSGLYSKMSFEQKLAVWQKLRSN